MKKLFLVTFIIKLNIIALSQVPPLAFNYQGIARNSQGNFIPNQDIALKFTIMEGTANGVIIYIEEHVTKTNNFGLFNVAIGKGIPIQGTFAGINWASGDKFIKVEIDPGNKKNYILQGTTQFLSVPYALYAGKVKLIAGEGIKISNDTISIIGNVNCYWQPDQSGIFFKKGNVGIGNSSKVDTKFSILGDGNFVANFNSNYDWQTAVNLYNNTNNRKWSWVVGGSANNLRNYGVGNGNFGLVNGNTSGLNTSFPLMITKDDYVGINMGPGGTDNMPTANLHIKGTVRMQGLMLNNTLNKVLVTDNDGNLFLKDLSILATESWAIDDNGIYYNQGNVGIGDNSRNDTKLAVIASATQPWASDFTSWNDWQTSLNIRNSTNSQWFALVVGGINNTQPNYGVGEGNFGIVNANTTGLNTSFPILITKDDKVGIGMGQGGTNSIPKSRLQVRDGDIYIDQIGSGIIMKSPNGQCWRMTVSDSGQPVFTAIPCPN